MAEVVTGGEGPGWRDFRFSVRQTQEWMDGQERILEAGVDYPRDIPFKVLRRRLMTNANRQQGTARVWLDSEDRVHMIGRRGWGHYRVQRPQGD